MTATDRDRLVTVLHDMRHLGCSDIADALLPVIDRIANERAAAELRAAARDIRRTTVLGHIAERLERRADALDS